jgi:hypothetical protein
MQMIGADSFRKPASVVIAVAFLLAACGGEPSRAPAPASPEGSIGALKSGAAELSLLQAQSALTTGGALFTFGLVSSPGDLASGGSPQVWVAGDETSPALGPFAATYHRFSEEFADSAPRGAPGFYAAEVDIPSPGNWAVAAVAEDGSRRAVASGFMTVVAESVAQVGTRALAVKTPVGETDAERRLICTREPPDPMHYMSLDTALENGKPTVVNFGTPLLCESRMCGPVVDELLLVFNEVGAERANFIHVEVYPDRDQRKPAPEFLAWGFRSEPWTVVIDREGIIRAAFEGPVVAAQINEALEPLL